LRDVRHSQLATAFGFGASAVRNAERRREALAVEAALMQQHVSRGRLLDVGCDLGVLFEWFPRDRWERWGVELSPSAAAYASDRYGATVLATRLPEASLPGRSFDLITMIDMLYYVDDPRSELEAARRLLAPGGVLAVEIPGQAWILTRSRGPLCLALDGRWTRLRSDSPYLHWLTPAGLRRLLATTGFTEIEAHVILPPTNRSPWRNVLARWYAAVLERALRWDNRVLTWAPKYLVLARGG
jgi:SAM-dependent methyltransferase